MRGYSLERGGKAVCSLAYLPHGGKPIPDRQILPVQVGFQLLLGRIDNPANCLINAHRLLLNYNVYIVSYLEANG
jgi:hypothetical protein